MRPLKSESRFVMIEHQRRPTVHGMTGETIMSELCRRMIRGMIEIRLVTLITERRRSRKAAARMTRSAIDRNMCPKEGKAGLRMIERRRAPGVHRMTCRAVMGELSQLVIRRFRPCVIRLVT